MTRTIEATFDGEVLRPTETLDIAPQSKVWITVETSDKTKPLSFLDAAVAASIEGPVDWSENLEAYLYGGKSAD